MPTLLQGFLCSISTLGTVLTRVRRVDLDYLSCGTNYGRRGYTLVTGSANVAQPSSKEQYETATKPHLVWIC